MNLYTVVQEEGGGEAPERVTLDFPRCHDDPAMKRLKRNRLVG